MTLSTDRIATHSAHTWVDSPVGKLKLVASGEALAAILWQADAPVRVRLDCGVEDAGDRVLRAAGRQLQEYFAGRRRRFDLPLAFSGTPFQRQVWDALLTIPFGETRSYAQIATQIGHPRAARAVGAANGRNPLSIVAPCHRVIGAAGTLTGFAGGLEAKAYLLKLEGQPLRDDVLQDGQEIRRTFLKRHKSSPDLLALL